MTKYVFDFFANDVIYKFYEELKKIDSGKFGNKAIKFERKRLSLVYLYYESFRKNMRKMYMTVESKPMDRHKIASAMMFSILKARLVKVNRLVPDLPLELLLANEYIAFYCAVNIIEIYRRDMGAEEYSVLFPDTYIENEGEMSYLENTCKALYYTKSYKMSNILLFANALFMLERFTDEALGIKEINKKTVEEPRD